MNKKNRTNPAYWVDEWWNEHYDNRHKPTRPKQAEPSVSYGRDTSHREPADGLRAKDNWPIFRGAGDNLGGKHDEDDTLTPKDMMVLNLYSLQDALAEILLSKHEDYGPSNIADAPGGALNGIRVRIHDKVARLNNLIDNNKVPKNEPIRDTLVDIANYATIALMVIDGTWA